MQFYLQDTGAHVALARVLQDHVKTVLLPRKYPRVVEYFDTLPKTGTSKIDRQALAKRALAI